MSFDVFDISASGLYAQRLKLDTVASNIANLNTTRNEKGEAIPYVKKNVVFQSTYKEALDRPSTPSGSYRPALSASGNNMLLKGGITYDNGKPVNGVSVEEISESKEFITGHSYYGISTFYTLHSCFYSATKPKIQVLLDKTKNNFRIGGCFENNTFFFQFFFCW